MLQQIGLASLTIHSCTHMIISGVTEKQANDHEIVTASVAYMTSYSENVL